MQQSKRRKRIGDRASLDILGVLRTAPFGARFEDCLCIIPDPDIWRDRECFEATIHSSKSYPILPNHPEFHLVEGRVQADFENDTLVLVRYEEIGRAHV